MNNEAYNYEYERVLLGMMLIDNPIIDLIKLKVCSSAFYNPKYKKIYEVMINQWTRFHSTDTVSLTTELRTDYTSSVVSLMDEVPSSSNWEFYVDKINCLYRERLAINGMRSILDEVNSENIDDCINKLNTLTTTLVQSKGKQTQTVKDLCIEISSEMEAARKSNQLLLGFNTGWEQLNDITDGFQTQNLYVLGARPSIGKTACAEAIISNLCKNQIPCAFLSLEMSAKSLLYRAISSEAKLPSWQVRKGACLNYRDGVSKFMTATQKIFEYPLTIYDKNIKTDNQIFSTIRYEAVVNKTKVFAIDHLGLVKFSNPTAQRYADIGNFTSGLKDLAKELDVCILLLCQCGRDAEGKKPNMALLRESGNIEQDADVIMFLHREREVNASLIPTELIVEKNRDGKLGTVYLSYLGDYTKFVEDKNKMNDTKIPEVPVKEKQYETNPLF